MGIIFAILIGLFVWVFMIAPFVKIYRASRHWGDVFRQAREQAQEQARRQQRPRDGRREAYGRDAYGRQGRRKKKIDPSVGEYVEFTETTEVRQTSATDGSDGRRRTTTTTTEQQITDVTWEDLP